MRAAERGRFRDDGARDLALVEGVAALLLQQPEGFGEIGIAVDLAGDRRLAVDVPGRNRIRIESSAAVAQRQRRRQAPVMGDALRHRKTVLGIIDRRLEHLLEGYLAEAP